MLLVVGAEVLGGLLAGQRRRDPFRVIVQARIDPSLPGARATLDRDGDRGILRVSGLPQHRDRIYEVWIARGEEVRPAGLFQTDRSVYAAAAIPTGLDGADQVMVSLEPTVGGARNPRATRW